MTRPTYEELEAKVRTAEAAVKFIADHTALMQAHAVAEAVAAEREACAKACDALAVKWATAAWHVAGRSCADAIRARGDAAGADEAKP